MLVRIGKAHHTTGATDAHHLKPRRFKPDLDGSGGGQGQGLAVVDDKADAGHQRII
jgi:hypothetical protein